MATKEFPLDASALGPGGAASVVIDGTTDQDVVNAIETGTPFPSPQIQLGDVSVSAKTGNLVFAAGPGTVQFNASASVRTGVGIFNTAADAIASLQLDAPPQLDLTINAPAGARYLSMVWAYQASGDFTGTSPIGAIGSLTFGASGSSKGTYAILHQFAGSDSADKVIGETVSSWRLPRQVKVAGDLHPGTWLIGECDGNLAIQIAAVLGYDINYVRKLNLLNLTRQLSAKIDLGLKATFGFSVSGRYLVVVGREDTSNNVRLRLFKQAQNGVSFALNASAGIQVDPGLPATIDDFVSAVFGVQGQQVLNDLRQWTDPNADLGQMAARLGLSEAKKLLKASTGIDADADLALAHAKLMSAINTWYSLPDRASSALWSMLGKLGVDPAAKTDFTNFLTTLSDSDPQKRAQSVAQALQNATFGDTLKGKFLASIADQGLLALTDQLGKVQQVASTTLSVVDGDVIGKLQTFISQELNLDDVLKKTDPSQLNDWIVARLGDFLDKKLDTPALKEVQTAIQTVLNHAQDIYAKAIEAMTNRYSIELAATYQRTVTGQALVDVVFDLSSAASPAGQLFQQIMANSNLNDLFIKSVTGVSINQATMSHEISRDATAQVHLPFFDSKTEHITDSIASLSIEHNAGRVLVYQLQASDKVMKNRYLSQMQIFGRIVDGTVSPDSTESYQMLLVKPKMTLSDLEFRTRPFIDENLAQLFGSGASSLESFYLGMDRTAEDALHNGVNEFGNTLLNLQSLLPASVLQAWITPLNATQINQASMRISRALQARLRQILPLFYFQNIDHLQANAPAAALLVWAAMPISTSIAYDFETKEIHQFNTDKDPFWNWPDMGLRRTMAQLTLTHNKLIPMLQTAHDRLMQAGLGRASDFTAHAAGEFQSMAIVDEGAANFSRLSGLLSTEAAMINGSVSALKEIQQAVAAADGTPSKKMDPSLAITALAEAGATLTETFNAGIASIYGDDSLRSLSSMFLLEATNALPVVLPPVVVKAMLNLIVLKENTTFNMSDYLTGTLPDKSQVALSQSLVGL